MAASQTDASPKNTMISNLMRKPKDGGAGAVTRLHAADAKKRRATDDARPKVCWKVSQSWIARHSVANDEAATVI